MQGIATRRSDAQDFVGMDDEARGKAIQDRRLRHGIGSVREFREKVYGKTGLSRGAISAAEAGRASEGTYQRLEAWLDWFDGETSDDTSEPAVVENNNGAETVEFTVEGDFGVRVTVKGPITNHEMLRADVTEIIRSIRESNPPV